MCLVFFFLYFTTNEISSRYAAFVLTKTLRLLNLENNLVEHFTHILKGIKV